MMVREIEINEVKEIDERKKEKHNHSREILKEKNMTILEINKGKMRIEMISYSSLLVFVFRKALGK